MKEKLFKNKHGKFSSGTRVYFVMENNDTWGGDRLGILTYNPGENKWVIRTDNSGEIGIGGYLEAYQNSIKSF